jgi:hypothetical protein
VSRARWVEPSNTPSERGFPSRCVAAIGLLARLAWQGAPRGWHREVATAVCTYGLCLPSHGQISCMYNSTYKLVCSILTPAACNASAVCHFHHPVALSAHPFHETRQGGSSKLRRFFMAANAKHTYQLHKNRQIWAAMQKPVEQNKLGRQGY